MLMLADALDCFAKRLKDHPYPTTDIAPRARHGQFAERNQPLVGHRLGDAEWLEGTLCER